VADLLEGAPLVGFDPDAVAAASSRVRHYCGWHIAPPVVDDTAEIKLWRGVGRLPSKYVTAVSAVTIDGIAVTSFTWTPGGRLKVTDRAWIGGENWHHHYRPWTAVVTFTHGYPVCPPDVRQIVARLSKAGFAEDRVSQAQVDDTHVIYDTTPGLADLDPYALIVVA
jgi:hypothetical protein